MCREREGSRSEARGISTPETYDFSIEHRPSNLIVKQVIIAKHEGSSYPLRVRLSNLITTSIKGPGLAYKITDDEECP
jgi:hypothetical protein